MEKLIGLKPYTFIGVIIITGIFIMAGIGKMQMGEAVEFVKWIFGAMALPVAVDRFKNGGK